VRLVPVPHQGTPCDEALGEGIRDAGIAAQ
jgi:hypothetical protein